MDNNSFSSPRFGIWIGLTLILVGIAWFAALSPLDESPAALGPLFALSLPGLLLLMNASAYISCTRLNGSAQSARAMLLALTNTIAFLALISPFMMYLMDLPVARPLEQAWLEQVHFLTGPLGLPIAAVFTYKFLDIFREGRSEAEAA